LKKIVKRKLEIRKIYLRVMLTRALKALVKDSKKEIIMKFHEEKVVF